MVGRVLSLVAGILLIGGVAFAQCTATYPGGSKVTLHAKPCQGCVFDHWEGVICEEGQKSKDCTFTMPPKATPPNQVNAKAVFTQKPPQFRWRGAVFEPM
jgi:hypothetical protein